MTNPAEPGRRSNDLKRVIVLWAALSVPGVVGVIVGLPHLLPVDGSDSETFNNTTIVVFTALAVPVAMFVWVFLGFSLAKFRVRGRPTEDGPPIQARAGVQIGWLGITSALCLFLVVWGMVGMYRAATAAPATLTVNVTGRQWSWTFSYPQYGVTSHVLELPAGRPVKFNITSRDVLHGFSVTELGVRLDANPGVTVTTDSITPTLSQCGSDSAQACQCGAGGNGNCSADYMARCIELCGTNHSNMAAPVKVVSTASFQQWLNTTGSASP